MRLQLVTTRARVDVSTRAMRTLLQVKMNYYPLRRYQVPYECIAARRARIMGRHPAAL